MLQTNKRECGSCTACCKTHRISEIAKKEGTWCQYCDRGKGCRIYAHRPQNCRDFRCGWLCGLFDSDPHEAPPHKTGVVVDATHDANLGYVMVFFEVRLGALKGEVVRRKGELIQARKIPLLHVHLDGSRILYCPQDRLMFARDLVADDDRTIRVVAV